MERTLKEKLVGGTFGKVPVFHSRRMSAIRSKGNRTTEARLRAMLVRAGIRGWKANPRGLLGSPDIYFPGHRIVVFADGCYWHGCPRCGHVGKVNRAYWSAKIQGTRDRDARTTKQLEGAGYRVLRFWEHELAESPSACILAVRAAVS